MKLAQLLKLVIVSLNYDNLVFSIFIKWSVQARLMNHQHSQIFWHLCITRHLNLKYLGI